jgi:Na+/alanine symporter
MFTGPVPGFFGIIAKTASGKLPTLQVVVQAFTTDTFAGTGIICAITAIEILFFLAFQFRHLHW